MLSGLTLDPTVSLCPNVPCQQPIGAPAASSSPVLSRRHEGLGTALPEQSTALGECYRTRQDESKPWQHSWASYGPATAAPYVRTFCEAKWEFRAGVSFLQGNSIELKLKLQQRNPPECEGEGIAQCRAQGNGNHPSSTPCAEPGRTGPPAAGNTPV